MKLVPSPSFALLLAVAAVLFSVILGIGALSDAEMKRLDLVEISSPKKKSKSMSSHLTIFRHESVVNIIHVLSENRGRRLRPDAVVGVSAKSAKTTSKSAKASSSSCQAKLDTCQAAAAAPKWLFVQMADMCTLYRNVDGEYHIESRKFHKTPNGSPIVHFSLKPLNQHLSGSITSQSCLMMRRRDTSRTQKERAAATEKDKHMGQT
eukprot:scaffold5865_cov84-Skeletonema_dohrnii-CCMP3373.AAC.5